MQPSHDGMQPVEIRTDRVGELMNELAKVVSELTPGDRAELRRGDPDDPGSPAFWRIAISRLAPRKYIDLESPNSRSLSQWVVILGALAQLEGLHSPRRNLGRALAEAGFSELRLTRLLRAEDGQLLGLVRQAVHFLAAKGQEVDVADLARLILYRGPKIRRSIASQYFTFIEK